MRRILRVADDLHIRLAIGAWLKQCRLRVAFTDGDDGVYAGLNGGVFNQMWTRSCRRCAVSSGGDDETEITGAFKHAGRGGHLNDCDNGMVVLKVRQLLPEG